MAQYLSTGTYFYAVARDSHDITVAVSGPHDSATAHHICDSAEFRRRSDDPFADYGVVCAHEHLGDFA